LHSTYALPQSSGKERAKAGEGERGRRMSRVKIKANGECISLSPVLLPLNTMRGS